MSLSVLRAARATGETIAARDLLLGAGYDEARIARALDATSYEVRAAARRFGRMLGVRLVICNGRKRERTLTAADVVGAIADSLTVAGYGWRHGGYPTANSYGYAWDAVSCASAYNSTADLVYVALVRAGGRGTVWGISRNTDRAKSERTRARNLETILHSAERGYDVAISRKIALYLIAHPELIK